MCVCAKLPIHVCLSHQVSCLCLSGITVRSPLSLVRLGRGSFPLQSPLFHSILNHLNLNVIRSESSESSVDPEASLEGKSPCLGLAPQWRSRSQMCVKKERNRPVPDIILSLPPIWTSLDLIDWPLWGRGRSHLEKDTYWMIYWNAKRKRREVGLQFGK